MQRSDKINGPFPHKSCPLYHQVGLSRGTHIHNVITPPSLILTSCPMLTPTDLIDLYTGSMFLMIVTLFSIEKSFACSLPPLVPAHSVHPLHVTIPYYLTVLHITLYFYCININS